MTSHHEYTDKRIKDHDQQRPFAPENGQPLRFAVGDVVIFTNEYGVCFKQTVTGIYKPDHTDMHYAAGRRYVLDTDAHWFPHAESELRLAGPDDPDRFFSHHRAA